jgi:PAS domain S-box-containing protein
MGDLLLTESVDANAAAASVPAAAALAVLDCVPAAAVLLDEQDRIAFANAQVVHRFGYAKAELHGQNIARLIRDGLGSARLWLAAQPPTARARLGAYHKDGTRLTCDTSLSKLDIEGRHFTLCVLHEMLPLPAGDEGTVTRFRLNEAQRIARIGSWTWDIGADEHWWSDELFRMLDLAPDGGVRPFDRFLELIHPHASTQLARKRVPTASHDPSTCALFCLEAERGFSRFKARSHSTRAAIRWACTARCKTSRNTVSRKRLYSSPRPATARRNG